MIYLRHDELTVMYSDEPKKELPGYMYSIGRSPDLQAGFVVLITAMGK